MYTRIGIETWLFIKHGKPNAEKAQYFFEQRMSLPLGSDVYYFPEDYSNSTESFIKTVK